MDAPTTFDVVIFDKATKEIVSLYAESLSGDAARLNFNDAVKHSHLNYDVDVVESGTFKKGDYYQ